MHRQRMSSPSWAEEVRLTVALLTQILMHVVSWTRPRRRGASCAHGKRFCPDGGAESYDFLCSRRHTDYQTGAGAGGTGGRFLARSDGPAQRLHRPVDVVSLQDDAAARFKPLIHELMLQLLARPDNSFGHVTNMLTRWRLLTDIVAGPKSTATQSDRNRSDVMTRWHLTVTEQTTPAPVYLDALLNTVDLNSMTMQSTSNDRMARRWQPPAEEQTAALSAAREQRTAAEPVYHDASLDMVARNSTAVQPAASNSSIGSPTQWQLPARQPDSNDGEGVSTTPEQPLPQADGDDERSIPSWWLIPGIKFVPTDQELVFHYLRHKVLELSSPKHQPVREGEDVYGVDANKITLDVSNGDKDLLGFFFVRKEGYTNGCFYSTPTGFWMVRGPPSGVEHGGRVIAFKTSMDYYRGRTPYGRKTAWSMLEYALNTNLMDLSNIQHPWMNSYVVCKVCKRGRETMAAIREKEASALFRRLKMRNRALKPSKATIPRRIGGVRRILGKRKRPDFF
ncbi:hypothetical protein ABZP36_003610 [Zizania latifolia]